MNADKARQITKQSVNKLLSEKEASWLLELSKFIYLEIEKQAILGYSELRLDLKTPIILHSSVSKDFDFLRLKLEAEGYEVSYVLERSPYGKREILISW